jgi:hypothetical protein
MLLTIYKTAWRHILDGRKVSRRDARYRCDNSASLWSYVCNINKTRLYCVVSLHIIPFFDTSVNGEFVQSYFIYLRFIYHCSQ